MVIGNFSKPNGQVTLSISMYLRTLVLITRMRFFSALDVNLTFKVQR